jgi:hypothetical protein
MRIKKHEKTKNEYIRAGDVWVRNFTIPLIKPLSLTSMVGSTDYLEIIQNETLNSGKSNIAEEKGIRCQKILIVGDGYDFKNRHLEIQEFPEDVFVMAINSALREWQLMLPSIESSERRAINAYVINNPYPESMKYMPRKELRYYPTCISSARTYSNFINGYLGNLYVYDPTPEKHFGLRRKGERYCIDDYRNPICAAIGLAFQFGVKKLMLMCCDDSFEAERDAAVQLENGLWTYPHHVRAQEIIDANLYWLKKYKREKIETADYSNGAKYKNADYIACMEDAIKFFSEEEEKTTDDETAIIT